MRPAPARVRRFAPHAIACLAALCLAASARAQESERLDLSVVGAFAIERFNSLGADTAGLSANSSPDGGVLVDFRVLDLPGKAGARPALHVLGGMTTTTRILGPAVPGMRVQAFKVFDLATGVRLEIPVDALLKGNAGVALRLGWDGAFLLTRTDDQEFLSRSMGRVEFVRTSGALAGSSIGFGSGYDETYGWDASHGRSEVRLGLEARVLGHAAPAPPAPATKPGAKAPPAPPPGPVQRLAWIFLDVSAGTDGGPGADGMRARAGLGFDLAAFTTAAFAPRR